MAGELMLSPQAAQLLQQTMSRSGSEAATDAAIADLDRALLIIHRITDVGIMPNTNLIEALHLIETSKAQMQAMKSQISSLQTSLEASRAAAAAARVSSSMAVGGSSPMTQTNSDSSSSKSEGVSVGATVGIAGASLLIGGLIGYSIRGNSQ